MTTIDIMKTDKI